MREVSDRTRGPCPGFNMLMAMVHIRTLARFKHPGTLSNIVDAVDTVALPGDPLRSACDDPGLASRPGSYGEYGTHCTNIFPVCIAHHHRTPANQDCKKMCSPTSTPASIQCELSLGPQHESSLLSPSFDATQTRTMLELDPPPASSWPTCLANCSKHMCGSSSTRSMPYVRSR